MKLKLLLDGNLFSFFFLTLISLSSFSHAQCPIAPANDPYYVIFSTKQTNDTEKYCPGRLGVCKQDYISSTTPKFLQYNPNDQMISFRLTKNVDYYKLADCSSVPVNYSAIENTYLDNDTILKISPKDNYFPIYEYSAQGNLYRKEFIVPYYYRGNMFNSFLYIYRSQSLEAIYKKINTEFNSISTGDIKDCSPKASWFLSSTIVAVWRQSQLVNDPNFDTTPPACSCVPALNKCKRTIPCADASDNTPCFELYDCLKDPCSESDGCEDFTPSIKTKKI